MNGFERSPFFLISSSLLLASDKEVAGSSGSSAYNTNVEELSWAWVGVENRILLAQSHACITWVLQFHFFTNWWCCCFWSALARGNRCGLFRFLLLFGLKLPLMLLDLRSANHKDINHLLGLHVFALSLASKTISLLKSIDAFLDLARFLKASRVL